MDQINAIFVPHWMALLLTIEMIISLALMVLFYVKYDFERKKRQQVENMMEMMKQRDSELLGFDEHWQRKSDINDCDDPEII